MKRYDNMPLAVAPSWGSLLGRKGKKAKPVKKARAKAPRPTIAMWEASKVQRTS